MTSVIQGLFITAGILFIYQYAVQQGHTESLTRTMVFTVLISANILLTLVNRSFYYSIWTTMKYKNNLVLLIIGISTIITALLIYVKPFARFFGFESLNTSTLLFCIATGFASVIWYEAVKWKKRSDKLQF